MNTSKKINVNFSSLVGLKAELLRKQTEIKESKVKQDAQPKISKPHTKRKKIRNKTPKIEPEFTEIEDFNTLRKSKLMLQAKSMLYDKLKKTGGDESGNYLVDFANKSESSEDEFHKEEDYEDANSDPEDDWIEYRDCFGRTRKCLRQDLPKMREKDDVVKREITKEAEPEQRQETNSEPVAQLPEKEPEIETMRKKWEEQMERLADKSDIHYQDVLFDEARAHGVGYYGFSQNEEERAKQQENLAKLRKETEQRQKEMQEVRDLKSKMELNRLRAATIRQRVRAGLPAQLTEEEEAALRSQIKLRNSNETHESDKDTNSETVESASKPTEPENRVDNSLIVVEDKIKAFGELLGKRPKWNEMSQEEWVYKRRKDRLGEFAPVYENFRRSGSLKSNRDNETMTREDENEDPVRIKAVGPEPTDLWETQAPFEQNDDVKQEKIEKNTAETKDLKNNEEKNVLVEDSDSEEEIGPLPPPAFANSAPPSFINSFVPQPISESPSLPVSFVRSIPPPPIVNFSVPPPSIIPPVSIPPPPFTSQNKVADEPEESSDSDDSIIIGPVPPPSMSNFSSNSTQNCGPRLIDNGHLNLLSQIPLPGAVQFSDTRDRSNIASDLPDREYEAREGGRNSADNLEAIAAGLKYLRQKFEKNQQ